MNSESVCHYTSLEAALHILREIDICFHATRFDSMNDPWDYKYGMSIVQEINQDFSETDTKGYPYIASFSKSIDNPLMWRTYNAQVCLVFYKEKLIREGLQNKLYGDCEYASDANRFDAYYKALNKYKFINVNNRQEDYLNIAVLLKHSDFKFEDEFRVFISDYEGFTACYNTNSESKCDIEDKEIPVDVKFKEVKNGDIVYYKEIHFPKDALQYIILHEFDNGKFESIKRHLNIWLTQNDYENVDIMMTSNAPIIL